MLNGTRMLRLRVLVVAVLLVAPACFNARGGDAGGGSRAESGKKMEPIHLTIGYQPYATQGWSGVAMRRKEFWKKYLPEGSTVNFQVGLQGAVIVSQLLAGKQQIGYMGDMPSLIATSKRQTRDVRIVATLGISQDLLSIFLVRKDAPEFSSPKDAVKWMDGKTVATPQGSAADRVTQAVFRNSGVRPSAYLNQSIEVISSNFQNHRIDAATVWEPIATRLVNQGLARRVASGVNFDENGATFLVVAKDLIDKRPDIVEAYLKAELEAQQWVADPANAMELARFAVQQTEGYTVKDMWDSMFEVAQGGHPGDLSNRMPFIVDKEAQDLIDKSWAFLYGIKMIPQAKPFDGFVLDGIARTVLTKSGANFPVQVKHLAQSEFKG